MPGQTQGTAVRRPLQSAPSFLDAIINQMDANEEIFKLILAEDRMRELFTEFLARSAYDQIREG